MTPLIIRLKTTHMDQMPPTLPTRELEGTPVYGSVHVGCRLHFPVFDMYAVEIQDFLQRV